MQKSVFPAVQSWLSESHWAGMTDSVLVCCRTGTVQNTSVQYVVLVVRVMCAFLLIIISTFYYIMPAALWF